jgi:outer membrane protein assembly factor BamB
MSNLALLGLLAFMQSAGAYPQQDKEVKKEAKKADKAAAKDSDKKEDKKEEKKDEKKTEATAPAAATPAVKVRTVVKGALAPAAAPGGVAAPPADNEFTDAITLPTNRDIKNRLQIARDDAIPNKEWGQAAKLLQSVLDSKEDFFVPVKKGPVGKEKIRWVSAKAEANRLLGEMKPEGLQFYEVQYGGQAKKLLAQAKKNGDPQLLAEVAQKYFHAEVGAEATDLLGTYHLDRGRPLMAALCYDRLLHREGADQLSGFTLFKAAFAFRLAGDQANAQLAKQTMRQMAAKISRDGAQIGDDAVTLEQLQKELDRATAPEVFAAFDWPLFRGNLNRNGTGRGSAPFLENKWQKSNLDLNLPPGEQPKLNAATRQWVEEAIRQQQYKPEPMIPAFTPIAAAGKLVYRSFWGIHCVDVKTGELLWESRTNASLDALVGDLDRKQDVQNWFQLYKQGANQNIIFENSVIGSLSTDNARIYAVDDLALPPHPTATQGNPWGWNGGGNNMGGAVSAFAKRSRLEAIDLESGKLVWEHGDEKYDHSDLTESYFLGPPLPLAGKLYLLTEKNGELRLVCLEAADGKQTWAQTLANAKDKLLTDVNRRVQAVNLSYAEGILVCPTNAGAILGIDLLSRSLVWAFPYREKSKDPNADQQRMNRRMMVWPPQDNSNLQKLSGEWKMSAPVIQEGKVVFTAPDGTGIYCLNLQDGDALWQAERRDDLYLAGVFGGKVLLVGKGSCRALSLADGKKELWKVETGLPSGMGVASGNYYYLPLKNGEVYKLDLEKGKVAAKSPAPKNAKGEREVPGNLLFYDGDVISQTETMVTCYPQVEYRVAQIDALLQKTPNDPVLLTERGEVRLYKGDLPGAVADLRSAVQNHPAPALLSKTRDKLYTTLTELMQADFGAAEQYLTEYRDLCQVPVPDNATPEQRQKAEEAQRQRYAGYLCLVADGREKQGRLVEAFQAYLDFGTLAENKELVTVINDRSVKARPDVWAQGRIAALVAKATPEQRKPLEAEIARRWQSVRDDKDPNSLPRFVAAFGSLFAAGREARLQLAERLMAGSTFLDAELHLLQLRGQHDDRTIAARAVEALARLMTRKGLLEDAAYYYRVLGHDYAKVVIREGKTGADFFNELATDKRFLPYIDDLASPLLGASISVKEIQGAGISLPQHYLPFDVRGDLSPFFQRYRLAWTLVHTNNMNSFQLQLVDRDANETRWTLTAPATRATYSYMGMNNFRFPAYTKGHLVVLYLGHIVYAIDLEKRKELWHKDLLSPDRFNMEQPYYQYLLSLDREGALHLSNPQGINEKLGQIGPVTASYVCLRTQEGLVALDPVHGTTLWTKTDVTPQTQIFGDDEYVYLVEQREDNRITSTKALRGRDGATADVADFGAAFLRRQKALGGRLLVSENDPTGGLVLRLYDIPSGRDLWKKNLPPNAVVLKGEEPELAAVVDPDGKLTVVDLQRRQEVFHAAVQPTHLDKVLGGWVLRDGKHYFAILNTAADANQNPNMNMGFNMQGPWSNVFALRAEAVNGMVYAFDRATANLSWYRNVRNQMLLLEQFPELPMLVFTAKYQKMMGNAPASFTPVTETLSVDKRTGKLIYDHSTYSNSPQSQGQFHGLQVDRQAGIVDLIAHHMRLRFYVGESAARAGAANSSPRPNPNDPRAIQSSPLSGATLRDN